MGGLPLDLQDIVFALTTGLVVTLVITKVSKAFNELLQGPTRLGYRPQDFHRILWKCHTLFPREIMKIKGKVYTRGMDVRIKTRRSKSFEGRFIGANNENMICLLNKKFVIAQDIHDVKEIEPIEIRLRRREPIVVNAEDK